jgi:hypothetical protein
MQKTLIKHFILSLLLFAPALSSAQMFSVGEESERAANPFPPYVRAGVIPIDFSYQGNPSVITNGTSLAFTGLASHLAYESRGLNIGISHGGDWTGLDNRNYFHLDLSFINPFYLIRRPNFGAGVPIQLGTKITNVRSDAIGDEFSQTNLYAGAGVIAQLIFPEKIGFTAQLIPSYGFSTASGGLIGGNVFSLKGKARINFYNLIFGRNVSLGYDYIYDTYNIDGEEYDYDYSGHALTLGISL